MKLIRVGAGVLNQTPLDWDGNRRRIVEAVAEARRRDVSLLCLPELCVTGYGCEDAFHSAHVQRTAFDVLTSLLPETRGMIVSLGLPLAVGGGLFNTACLAVDGRLLGFAAKQNLAGEGIHYEPRWFKPWPADVRTTIRYGDGEFPVGDLIFDVGGVQLGFEICEDAWVPNRPGGELAQRGVDVILNPSASHFAFGKHDVRQRFVLEGSRAFRVGYLYANLLGNESGRAIYDGDALIASDGRLLAANTRFSFAEMQLIDAVIDIDATRTSRARSPSFRPLIRPEPACVRAAFDFPHVAPAESEPLPAAWERGEQIKEEEFSRAESLAFFDYLRKSRSRGFVVSISGGADSAAVSALVWIMVRLGVGELGREEFVRRLPYIAELAAASDERAIVRYLLTCAYQATRNSSTTTREAARDVATAIGAEFLEFDVDRLVQEYIGLVSSALGRELSWSRDDLALQNVQARVRAPSVWLLANLRGALLLSTSNRSEAAVGYATMDGDTAGGLSPIAGIDKAFLRRWLRWLETHGPAGVGPLPALSAVNCQPPTAELRPPSAKQTDEDDLMPYDVLDDIERAAIRDKLGPAEVLERLRTQHTHAPEQLRFWVERFFRLWCRNQWKRERYAPSFHLDDENLDPKTWCRFPILSGGYERELAELGERMPGR